MEKNIFVVIILILFINVASIAAPCPDYEDSNGFHVLNFNRDSSSIGKLRLSWAHSSGPEGYSASKIPIPKKILGTEISFLSVAISKDKTDTTRVSSNFALPIFGFAGYILTSPHSGGESPKAVQYFWVTPIYTQYLTNLKFHFNLPLVYSSLYLGENTDYYLFNKGRVIYTESVFGIRYYHKIIGISVEICKPWTMEYIDDLKYRPNINLFIMLGGGDRSLLGQ